jgi:citrate lyase subunit beta/citryl-CoA lyase
MQDGPLRTLLFVPATRPEWLAKAAAAGTDACVIDLEDSVPESVKAQARAQAPGMLSEAKRIGLPAFVRINATTTAHWLDDLRAVVVDGLWGIALSKADTPEDVVRVDGVLSYLERERGLAAESIDIQPLLETAHGMHQAAKVLAASRRVRSFFGGSARDGDINRELGYRWTRDGKETLFLRSKLILDGRAAGVAYPIGGTWADIQDTEGLAEFAAENRDLGYTGMYVIHPSHVPVVNQAFTPSSEDLRRYQHIIDALEAAHREGSGATVADGVLVDEAMATRARAYIAGARRFGLPMDHDTEA